MVSMATGAQRSMFGSSIFQPGGKPFQAGASPPQQAQQQMSKGAQASGVGGGFGQQQPFQQPGIGVQNQQQQMPSNPFQQGFQNGMQSPTAQAPMQPFSQNAFGNAGAQASFNQSRQRPSGGRQGQSPNQGGGNIPQQPAQPQPGAPGSPEWEAHYAPKGTNDESQWTGPPPAPGMQPMNVFAGNMNDVRPDRPQYITDEGSRIGYQPNQSGTFSQEYAHWLNQIDPTQFDAMGGYDPNNYLTQQQLSDMGWNEFRGQPGVFQRLGMGSAMDQYNQWQQQQQGGQQPVNTAPGGGSIPQPGQQPQPTPTSTEYSPKHPAPGQQFTPPDMQQQGDPYQAMLNSPNLAYAQAPGIAAGMDPQAIQRRMQEVQQQHGGMSLDEIADLYRTSGYNPAGTTQGGGGWMAGDQTGNSGGGVMAPILQSQRPEWPQKPTNWPEHWPWPPTGPTPGPNPIPPTPPHEPGPWPTPNPNPTPTPGPNPTPQPPPPTDIDVEPGIDTGPVWGPGEAAEQVANMWQAFDRPGSAISSGEFKGLTSEAQNLLDSQHKYGMLGNLQEAQTNFMRNMASGNASHLMNSEIARAGAANQWGNMMANWQLGDWQNQLGQYGNQLGMFGLFGDIFNQILGGLGGGLGDLLGGLGGGIGDLIGQIPGGGLPPMNPLPPGGGTGGGTQTPPIEWPGNPGPEWPTIPTPGGGGGGTTGGGGGRPLVPMPRPGPVFGGNSAPYINWDPAPPGQDEMWRMFMEKQFPNGFSDDPRVIWG